MPPLPKDPRKRQRHNRSSTGATLEARPAAFVPLPPRQPPWKPETMAWWGLIWASPMAGEWVDADVPGLVKLAQLEEDFWDADTLTERVKASAEARYLNREFGLTPMARRSLQWEIKRVEEAAVRATPATEVTTPRRGTFGVLIGKAS